MPHCWLPSRRVPGPGLLLLGLTATCTQSPVDHRTPADAPFRGDADLGDDDSSSGGDTFLPCTLPGDLDRSGAAVSGTRLANLAIQWPAPLELCKMWEEGQAIDTAAARKVRVVIPPQLRPDLAAIELGAVGLEQVLVERSPFADGRFRIDDCAPVTEIVQDALNEQATSTSLSVTIAFDLGAAGRLLEQYMIWRNEGDATPIDITGDPLSSFVWFSYQAPGADEPDLLGLCSGSDTLEDRAAVLTGFCPNESVTVLRFFRSQFTVAGSAPMHLVNTQIAVSSHPWAVWEVAGPWAQTYTAGHHNWDETSLADVSLAPIYYHLFFKPGAQLAASGGDMIERAYFRHIQTYNDQPVIEVHWKDVETGAKWSTDCPMTDPGGATNWARVDDAALTGMLSTSCGAGEIFSFGSLVEGYFLRFLTCPRVASPGFDLVGLLPVAFQLDPHQAGQHLTSDAVSETQVNGHAGFQVALGTATALIYELPGDYLGVEVRDPASQPVYQCTAMTRDLARAWTPAPTPITVETLSGRNEAAEVTASLRRRYAFPSVGSSAYYVPVDFEICFAGACYRVEAWDRLDYVSTHHNDSDELVALTDGMKFFWRVGWDASNGFGYFVRAEDSQGTEILPEVMLTPIP